MIFYCDIDPFCIHLIGILQGFVHVVAYVRDTLVLHGQCHSPSISSLDCSFTGVVDLFHIFYDLRVLLFDNHRCLRISVEIVTNESLGPFWLTSYLFLKIFYFCSQLIQSQFCVIEILLPELSLHWN